MPFKSEAQRRLFHHLVAQGKLSPKTVEEYDHTTHGKLPQHVEKKAFGGQGAAKKGVRCLACDYPLDAAPVAMDAGDGCPRCGFGSAKDVPRRARGGEVDGEKHAEEHRLAFMRLLEDTDYRPTSKQLSQLKNKYPVPRHADMSIIPVYNERGERTEQFVRGYQNPRRFDQERKHSMAFSDLQNSDEWRLRKELASSRGSQSGVPSQYSTAYLHPEEGSLLPYSSSEIVSPRPTAEQLFEDQVKKEQYAHGGEVCPTCGARKAFGGEAARGDLKELYPRKKEHGADLDDGRAHSFTRALKHRRG